MTRNLAQKEFVWLPLRLTNHRLFCEDVLVACVERRKKNHWNNRYNVANMNQSSCYTSVLKLWLCHSVQACAWWNRKCTKSRKRFTGTDVAFNNPANAKQRVRLKPILSDLSDLRTGYRSGEAWWAHVPCFLFFMELQSWRRGLSACWWRSGFFSVLNCGNRWGASHAHTTTPGTSQAEPPRGQAWLHWGLSYRGGMLLEGNKRRFKGLRSNV